jgi:hypothetical protein
MARTVQHPYRIELATAKRRGSDELVWKRHPTTTFETPGKARQFAEKLMEQRRWWVSYRIMGPEGEVPWPQTKESRTVDNEEFKHQIEQCLARQAVLEAGLLGLFRSGTMTDDAETAVMITLEQACAKAQGTSHDPQFFETMELTRQRLLDGLADGRAVRASRR